MNINEQLQVAAKDPQALREGIAGAHIVPLLMSYVHLTGDKKYFEQVRPFIKGGWDYQQEIPEAIQASIRADLIAAIEQLAQRGDAVHQEPTTDDLHEMINVACGAEVPEMYLPIFYEETCFGGHDYRAVQWTKPISADKRDAFKVIIAGAGFSGLCMGVRLKQAGIPFEIYEKNAGVGGTWLENTYPGVGVDTPCHFYSFSLMPNPDWPEFFSKGNEIRSYLERIAEHFGLMEHIRFNERIESAEYDEVENQWRVTSTSIDGVRRNNTARVFISAVGILNVPRIPNFPGLESFEGEAFHSARWDHSVDIRGKRVAMVGTGATGIQVGPAIAPEVEQLTIFQRSKHWVIKHPMYHEGVPKAVSWASHHVPYYLDWFRFGLFWAAADGFHHTIKIDPNWRDPEHSLNAENAKMREDLIAYAKAELGERTDLLEKTIPEFPPFGKRMLRDNDWYKMLCRPNVELFAGDLDRIEPDGIVAGGEKYPADVIVFATGFDANRMLGSYEVRGRHGVSIRDRWGDEDPRAHLGISVPEFPNFFVLYGPNTNLAHGGSAFFHSECQARYIADALRQMIENDWVEVEVKQAPYEAYNQRVDEEHRGMVWSHPGVTSWYKNKKGRVVMNSPWRLAVYRGFTAYFDSSEYHHRTAADSSLPPDAVVHAKVSG